MSHSRFKPSFAYRGAALFLGLAYWLQTTILPILHYRIHFDEHSHSSIEETTCEAHDHQDIIEQVHPAVVGTVHDATPHHHSSHDTHSCSICSNIYKATYFSHEFISLTNLFPEQPTSLESNEPRLSVLVSSNSPRGPPAKFA